MTTFSKAFAEARKKFQKTGDESDYVFEWEGKKYNILRKGETKSEVMEKYAGKSAPKTSRRPKGPDDKAPAKSARPKARKESSKTEKSEESKSKKTEYKDDEKMRRTKSTGTVPKGYNRVSIPGMARGGMVKKGHCNRKSGMFYKSGSPKGNK